jgi:hypothetical protein
MRGRGVSAQQALRWDDQNDWQLLPRSSWENGSGEIGRSEADWRGGWYCFGEYDLIVMADVPDGESMSAEVIESAVEERLSIGF